MPSRLRRLSETRVCSVPDCGRTHQAHGFCMTHYKRWLHGGDLGGPIQEKWAMVAATPDGSCLVETCDRLAFARGLCSAHYHRKLRTGRVRPEEQVVSIVPRRATCEVEGCGRQGYRARWCAWHYKQARTTGQVEGETPAIQWKRPPTLAACTAAGCDRPQVTRGWCERHYRVWRTHGVTPDEYAARVRTQGGVCPLCGRIPEKALVVDHDHGTGAVRGLLCDRCNLQLGWIEQPDWDAWVAAARAYLERHAVPEGG
jgi:hypothetical protein